MAVNYQQTEWSLADLFDTHEGPAIQAAFSELEAGVTAFEQVRSQLASDLDIEKFLKITGDFEKINHLASHVAGFAELWFATNTQDQNAQAFQARIQQLAAELENRTLFFNLWWKNLDEGAAARLMNGAGDYRYWLEEMRHFKPHTLSEAEEKVVNTKNTTGVQAFNNLYTAITNRYTFKINVDGEEKELTRGELMVYARHHRQDLRAQAYQELYRVYGQDGSILGQIYQTLVRDWRNEQVTLRRFENPISARNLVNDIPDQVVNTLLDVAERNTDVFQRYFRLKARLLGMERLQRYDVYAPIARSEKAFGFEQAAELVLDSFGKFDPQLAGLAQRVFDDNHLDSVVRKGKSGGAFCATITPDLSPWVLVNYQGRADDVATLAHELGHAIHSLLAAHHSLFTQQACLPLAETASTFGEMMLVDRMLADEKDESVRRDLLFSQVDDAYATIMRQAFFAMFERQAHEMIIQGASVDELAAVYLENLKKQFGDAVDVSDEFRWEWVSIPHIYHVPFYVYAYAFGQLLVFALYQQFKAEGEAFKPRYLKILAAGGSQAPVSVLLDAGIDVYSEAFWQGGFDVIRSMVEQLENLPVE